MCHPLHMPAQDLDADWRLRHLRKSTSMSMSELADAAGCHYHHLQMIETGHRRPSPELAQRIADALGEQLKRRIEPGEFHTPLRSNWVAP